MKRTFSIRLEESLISFIDSRIPGPRSHFIEQAVQHMIEHAEEDDLERSRRKVAEADKLKSNGGVQ
jgi:metal-responsive CopG/Arc/MetJ family transcriptional regulator